MSLLTPALNFPGGNWESRNAHRLHVKKGSTWLLGCRLHVLKDMIFTAINKQGQSVSRRDTTSVRFNSVPDAGRIKT